MLSMSPLTRTAMLNQLRHSLQSNLVLADSLGLNLVAIHLDEACNAMPPPEGGPRYPMVDGHAEGVAASS